ncbi:dTDP-4-dehydrorhamnose 3,5-epimerase [Atopobacter phocae]|uniref:dTDP-4-dehydrorhamnose 3,5-epimerase n=1 Tax=Atopobacter phocae TaxID=136492 RepID=UPI00046F6E51|nr:dTDP-4-dehydrorhamnose 3,5-epimerase [Atopobacter phocae]
MKVINTKFKDAKLIEMPVFGDERGFFTETYSKQVFEAAGLNYHFVQDNHSRSVPAHVLRGLHFQKPPYSQTKLLRVTKGAIYDVIVDLRQHSDTYGQWEGYILTSENKRQLLVPKGFAHGFITLVEDTEVQYKVDEFYHPESDSGIHYNSPSLSIDWPVDLERVIVSRKDQQHANFDKNIKYFE